MKKDPIVKRGLLKAGFEGRRLLPDGTQLRARRRA
jgi:hypothetical protein